MQFFPGALIGQEPSFFGLFKVRGTSPYVELLDASTDAWETAAFMPNTYGGGTIRAYWTWASTAITGNVRWGINLERWQDNVHDLDASSFSTGMTGNFAVAGTSGVVTTSTNTATNGNMDSIAAGEPCRVQIRREGGDGGDTMTGPAQLFRLWLVED